jgi:hypothetical protein
MTTADVYETVIVLLNHQRSDIVDSVEEGFPKQVALEVTGRMLARVQETREYILDFPLEKERGIAYEARRYYPVNESKETFKRLKPSGRETAKLPESIVSSDSCEELFKYIYDGLQDEGANILTDYNTSPQLYEYVKSMVGKMGGIIERNQEMIVRSCMLA